jgi:hypothetical protein
MLTLELTFTNAWCFRWTNNRKGDIVYTFAVAQAGTYTVRLLLAEVWHRDEGDRVFSVEVQGVMVLNGYDIVADVGFQVPVVKEATVLLEQGADDLTVALRNSMSSEFGPAVYAIEVLRQPATDRRHRRRRATQSQVQRRQQMHQHEAQRQPHALQQRFNVAGVPVLVPAAVKQQQLSADPFMYVNQHSFHSFDDRHTALHSLDVLSWCDCSANQYEHTSHACCLCASFQHLSIVFAS